MSVVAVRHLKSIVPFERWQPMVTSFLALHASLAIAVAQPVRTQAGVVASDHPVASEIGARLLAAGGNAVDAAIATALALGVANPTSSGIGGGGFALVYDARSRQVRVYDFRESAPRKGAIRDYWVNGKLEPSLATRGGLAVGVPGEVAGLERLSKSHGVLPWHDVVMPAANLARDGVAVSAFLAEAAASVTPRLTSPNEKGLALMLAPTGKVLMAGDRLKRPALAKTLRTIANQGARAFYDGPIARDIVATVRASGGKLSVADLQKYEVVRREPMWGQWNGYQVATMPLPSSGGFVLLVALGILERLPWQVTQLALDAPLRLHLIAEAMKQGFADRARWLGDTNRANQRMPWLLGPARLSALAKRISSNGVAPAATAGAVSFDDNGTSHLCVVDKEGNAVALTTTVNGYFGSKLVTTSGIVLNNQMDDFALADGAVNQFGLTQSADNLLGPDKRPLSSMTPTLVFDRQGVAACVGGSGGPFIISGVLQVILATLGHGLATDAAVAATRVHHQWSPDELVVESTLAASTQQALRALGHNVRLRDEEAMVQVIRVYADGWREASSDPKKGGRAAAEPAAAPTRY